MFTLQILDAGQTFLHALDGRPVSLGSAADASVRLSEPGVAPEHARIEPVEGGARLVALAEVRVNGAPVQDVPLQLGDRIEIGRAVLVVGRTVARAARPEDVLAGSVSRARQLRKKGSVRWLPMAAAIGLAAVVAVIAVRGGDSGRVRDALAYVEQLRNKGRLEEARQEIEQLRRAWAEADDDRLGRLDAAVAAIDQIDTARANLVARLMDPAITRTYAEWNEELQRLEATGEPDQRVAARQVRSRLRETLRERDEILRQQAIANRQAGTSADQTAGAASTAATAIDTSEVERFCKDGMFAQAMALVQAGFEQAEHKDVVTKWQACERSVRERATAALAELLQEARAAAADGRHEHAVALLQSGRHRFPSRADFQELGDELSRLEAQAARDAAGIAEAARRSASGSPPPTASGPAPAPAAADEPTELLTMAGLRSHMDAVRVAEEQDAFADAGRLLREAADAVRSRDAAFADRLLVRADEADLLASWHEAVVHGVQAGARLTATDASGRTIELQRVDGNRVIARSADGDAPIAWRDLDAKGVQALVKQLRATGLPALGAAALLYKQGEAEAAEAVLVEALRADAGLQPQVDRVIAHGRGENPGEQGYVLQKGTFVSSRLIEIEKRAKVLAGKLDATLRTKDAAARDAFVAATLATGGSEPQALAMALRDQFEATRDRLENHAIKKQVERLAAERDKLDGLRKHAKELIFDEVRYFYPYKPPAVSGERHAEYNRAQAEVNERVAALRDLWQGSRVKVRVPARVGEDLARLDWLQQQLSRLGVSLPEDEPGSALAPLEWARALPDGTTVGLQEFCLTAAERAQREQWQRVEAYNALIGKRLSVAQRDQLRITNEYRVMFGHRPLAAAETCCAASQGHADEMSRLGYFSHTSPTPVRKTPFDRMRNAGYMFGVSENIATTDGAQAAHDAWCRSSGHHRNLLSPSHREMGIGANGHYWVQNFGSGEVYRSTPEWESLKTH